MFSTTQMLCIALFTRKRRLRRQRSKWVHPLIKKRLALEQFNFLYGESRYNPDILSLNYYRMSMDSFVELLVLVATFIVYTSFSALSTLILNSTFCLENIPDTLCGRIVSFVCLIFGMLISMSYTNILMSHLTVKKVMMPITSLEDLAIKRTHEVMFLKYGAAYSAFTMFQLVQEELGSYPVVLLGFLGQELSSPLHLRLLTKVLLDRALTCSIVNLQLSGECPHGIPRIFFDGHLDRTDKCRCSDHVRTRTMFFPVGNGGHITLSPKVSPDFEDERPGYFQASTEGLYKDIWDMVKNKPENMIDGGHKTPIYDRLCNHNGVFFVPHVVQELLQNAASCPTVILKKQYLYSSFAFPIRYGFPFRRLFNYNLNKLREGGLIRHRLDGDKNRKLLENKDTIVNISWNHMYPIFTLYGCCLMLSVIILLVERVFIGDVLALYLRFARTSSQLKKV